MMKERCNSMVRAAKLRLAIMQTTLIAGIVVFQVSVATAQNVKGMLKNEKQKKEIFSAILKDDLLSREMMDSLMMKHHAEGMMPMDHEAASRTMKMNMMNMMFEMAERDTAMCSMMMGMMKDRPQLMRCLPPVNKPGSPDDSIKEKKPQN